MFCPKTHYLWQHTLFSILNLLQDLWPIIRVQRYRPSICESITEMSKYTPRGFPTYRKTPRKTFHAETLPVFPKSVFLGVFSIFPPRTFYRPSEDKLRELRSFFSAELRGNKMAAFDDFNIKLHLAWQYLCSSVKNSVININYTFTCIQVFMSFSFSLFLRFTWNSKMVYCYCVKHEPLFTFHSKQ